TPTTWRTSGPNPSADGSSARLLVFGQQGEERAFAVAATGDDPAALVLGEHARIDVARLGDGGRIAERRARMLDRLPDGASARPGRRLDAELGEPVGRGDRAA